MEKEVRNLFRQSLLYLDFFISKPNYSRCSLSFLFQQVKFSITTLCDYFADLPDSLSALFVCSDSQSTGEISGYEVRHSRNTQCKNHSYLKWYYDQKNHFYFFFGF